MTRLLIIAAIVALAACAAAPEPVPVPPESREQPVSEPASPRPVDRQIPDPPAPEPAPVEATPSPAPAPAPEGRQEQSESERPAPALEDLAPAPATPPEPAAVESRPADIAPDPTPSPSSILTGQVRVERDGREQPFAARHFNDTVVAWKPAADVTVVPMEEQRVVTRRSRFFPQTMVVTSGTQVRFPNLDSIQHNVFSLTPGHRFDVGLYGQAEGAAHTFFGSGMVELFCNVHPNMAAFMLVLDTPYFTTPDENGRFVLDGVPEGPGELIVWNYRAETIFQRRDMYLGRSNPPLEILLNINRPSVPQHSNKHGESYSRRPERSR